MTTRISGYSALTSLIRGYNGAYLISGFGTKSQFADHDLPQVKQRLDQVVQALDVMHGKGRWLGIGGGDPFYPTNPDIAHIIAYLHSQHRVPLLALQQDKILEWGGVPDFFDFVHYRPTVYKDDLAGKKQVVWHGLVGDCPETCNEEYIGNLLLGANNSPAIISGMIAAGGGPITLREAQAVVHRGLKFYYIKALARYPEVNGPHGSLQAWVDGEASHDRTQP